VVLFGILFGLVSAGGTPDVVDAVLTFLKVSGGGLVIGAGLGYAAWLFLKSIDDPLIETGACLVLALGAFWVAEVLHLSGVIATVSAGLLIGNHGRHLAMSQKVTVAVDNFFSVIEFLINSVLFLLIGLEIRALEGSHWVEHLPLVGAGILGLLAARALAVYPCWHLLNLGGRRRPGKWAHVLFWGGLRGSIPIALALFVLADPTFPEEYRDPLLVATFTVVMFSLLVQGLTVMPLLHWLGLRGRKPAPEEDYP
jgi:CPA1 family monovalent cation:H+ antiporter